MKTDDGVTLVNMNGFFITKVRIGGCQYGLFSQLYA